MSLLVKLKKYENHTKSSYGKWYTDTVYTGEIHTTEIAEIISKNTTFRPGEVKGLIDELVSEMKNQLQDSKVVVLDGFGRFRLVVESEGVAEKEDFNLRHHLKRIVCKFLPAGTHDAGNNGNKKNGPIKRNFANGAKVEWWVGE